MSRDPLFRTELAGEATSRQAEDAIHPRIGVWGRFDSAGFADLVQPEILEREIRRRLPESELRLYSPLDGGGALSSDPGFATVDPGTWSSRRATELAGNLDCVFVTGDLFGVSDDVAPSVAASGGGAPRLAPFLVEGLGPELEAACPVAWSAVSVAFDLEPEEAQRVRKALAGRPYVSVRDEASRLRLQRAGIESEIVLLPEPLLLLPRAFSEEVLARRLEYLKFMEWFPPTGDPLVIQLGPAVGERAETFAATLATALERSPMPLVLVDLGPRRARDSRLADALSRFPSIPIFRLPSDAPVSDIAAALAHARAFVGTSARASVACSAFGVPALVLDRTLGGTSRQLGLAIRKLIRMPAGAGADPAETAQLDAHFDRLAGLAEAALVRRLRRGGVSEEVLLARLRENDRVLESWRAAYAARSQQVVDLRLRIAAVAEGERKLAAEVKDLQDEGARRHHAWAAATAELATERAQVESISRDLAGERSHHESVSRDFAAERENLVRAIAERDELARVAGEIRQRLVQVEADLAEAKAQSSFEADQAERRQKRTAEEILSLRAELDRVRERLDKARAGSSELRISNTLLFTEIAEMRADGGRSVALVGELQAEVERLQAILFSMTRLER